MGLDTTHGAWNGPYSSFNKFRYSLADQIDIDLGEYNGYGGDKELSSINHDLMPLFNHSDCDGELTPDECLKISIGLKSVLDKLHLKDTPSHFEFTRFVDCIIKFRNGCILAYLENENIEFH